MGFAAWESTIAHDCNAHFARRVNSSQTFRLRRRANHWLKLARLAPDKEGRIAIVTDVGRGMRWTLWAARDEPGLKRGAKSGGLLPRPRGPPRQAGGCTRGCCLTCESEPARPPTLEGWPATRSPLGRRVAEREGFEPPIGLHLSRISSGGHSTTLPPL